MTLKFKIEYLSAIRKRYYQSTKTEKTIILNELCSVAGYNRKYAIRILAIKHHEGKKLSGRTKTYSERSIKHLKRMWVIMGEICSKKMVQALKTWLKYYEDDDCDDDIRDELMSMSHASIDRYLRAYKASLGRKKRTGTRPGKMFKNVIPLKSFDKNIDRPGHIEADTVAHCGDSLSGKFAWSLTFTDVYSGWTENRVTYGKDSDEVLSAIMDIKFKLPFPIITFNTDNGTEFLNRNLYLYFSDKKEIEFTRSRPYKKNDNAHVEQKNWTHVRESFGYERFDKTEQVEMMNVIYKLYLNNLYNFFVPQFKLIEKVRIGSKIVKKYDKPKTPYQRLLECEFLTMGQKEELRRKYKTLNPVKLREIIKRQTTKLNQFKSEVELELENVA